MEADVKPGDLVFLTQDFHKYIAEKNPKLKWILTNRLAKLEEIIDWESEKGKRIKAARELSGKWKDLSIEDNKYLVSIYYHDIVGRRGQQGVVEQSFPMFRYHPKTKKPFFEKVPDWIYREILKKCETFDVELKSDAT